MPTPTCTCRAPWTSSTSPTTARARWPTAFARFRLKSALVIGVETDMLFPIDQQREIAEQLRAPGRTVEFHAFPSLQGHDAFLVDLPRFEPAIGGFLATVRPGA